MLICERGSRTETRIYSFTRLNTLLLYLSSSLDSYPSQTAPSLHDGESSPSSCNQPLSHPLLIQRSKLTKNDATPQSSHETGLPTQWEVRHSNSKNLPYYFNASTKESRWEPPPGTDPDKIKTYMALHHSTPANPSSQLHSSQSNQSTEGKIRAAHLLVKHKDSRRPSSWKEPSITRSKEEALEILRGYEGRIKGGETSLGDLATSESDCSSARKKGDLYDCPGHCCRSMSDFRTEPVTNL